MNVTLDMPMITGGSPDAQIQQIKSYLYKMAHQLQYALSQTDSRDVVLEQVNNAVAIVEKKEKPPVQIFNEMKSLIIKSADIVEAYYEKIDELLSTSGKYVAQSDFGTYGEYVNQRLSADADRINQNINRIEVITSDIANTNGQIVAMKGDTDASISSLASVVNGFADEITGTTNFIKTQQAYIRYGAVGTTLDETGLASQNAPGIEIGDIQTLADGKTQITNKRFARFTAYGLELFGEIKDAPPVAYIKQNKLFITNAEVTSSFKLGGFMIQKSNGLSFDWVGG